MGKLRRRGALLGHRGLRVIAGPRRRLLTAGLVVGTALAATVGAGLAHGPQASNNWPYNDLNGASPVLAAVGDISCQPGGPVETEPAGDVCDQGTGATIRNQAQTATANQIEAMKPQLVAILGDEQYQVGRYEDFLGSYDHTYGAFKFLQRPTPGNHEFYDRNKNGKGETGVDGVGYFDYFNGAQLTPTGAFVTQTFTTNFGPTSTFTQPAPRPDGQAGATGDGWYSYNLGSWHIISLNVECAVEPGGCDPNGSWFASETQWLAQDLAANHAPCTMAYWHQPTFSVAVQGVPSAEGAAATAWWDLLYQHGADVVLNGHDHTYARYAPVDPTGKADPKSGIREFIVGTGGESLDAVVTNTNTPNLQAATGDYYGVMGLTLNPHSYQWDFESSLKSPSAPATDPATYRDSGTAACHGPTNS